MSIFVDLDPNAGTLALATSIGARGPHGRDRDDGYLHHRIAAFAHSLGHESPRPSRLKRMWSHTGGSSINSPTCVIVHWRRSRLRVKMV